MGRLNGIVFDSSYIPVMVASGIVAFISFRVIFPLLSKLVPSYRTLPTATQISWNNLLTSSLHSIVACGICILGFIKDENMDKDPIWWDCPTVRTSCAIVSGYLIQDIIMMFIFWKEIGGWLYVFHHSASVYAYIYVATFGVVPWFANFRLLAELSTVCVNNRWFFDTMKMKRTSCLPFFNGIMMTLTFFISRILAMFVYWHKVYTVYGTPDFEAVGHVKYVLYITCSILDLLNLYWFYKMCKGLVKTLTQSSNGQLEQVSVSLNPDDSRLKLE